jgi:hypothetical protein
MEKNSLAAQNVSRPSDDMTTFCGTGESFMMPQVYLISTRFWTNRYHMMKLAE